MYYKKSKERKFRLNKRLRSKEIVIKEFDVECHRSLGICSSSLTLRIKAGDKAMAKMSAGVQLDGSWVILNAVEVESKENE